jgi:anti-sigma regulatory factor (Ser/Thr protein kinase)
MPVVHHDERFRHEALLYAGQEEFLASTSAFIRDAVAAGEPTLVVVSSDKIARLRAELGADAEAVRFADMAEEGGNPARIIPVWRAFVDEHAGTAVRGIGEPVWADRSADELLECQLHEALLNAEFDGGSPWWLVCPYDVQSLPEEVVGEAYRSHPFVSRDGALQPNMRFDAEAPWGAFEQPLPEPADRAYELDFEGGSLRPVRAFVSEHAAAAGLDRERTDDLVLAVNELVTNSLRHGTGGARLRVWRDERALICEIRDEGRIEQPLIGRRHPAPDADTGRGLWLVNQLCDLVQLRSSGEGTVIRVHMAPA